TPATSAQSSRTTPSPRWATHASPRPALRTGSASPCPGKPAFVRTSSPRSDRLGESLDEVERRLGDLAPAVVDPEGVASVWHLHDLRHGGVPLLPLVGGVRDRPRHRVILLALDDQQGTAVWVLRVHLRLGPRVEVRVAHLHECNPGGGDVERVLLRLPFVPRVSP